MKKPIHRASSVECFDKLHRGFAVPRFELASAVASADTSHPQGEAAGGGDEIDGQAGITDRAGAAFHGAVTDPNQDAADNYERKGHSIQPMSHTRNSNVLLTKWSILKDYGVAWIEQLWRSAVKFLAAIVLGASTLAWSLTAMAAADPTLVKALQDAKLEQEKDVKAQKDLKTKLQTSFESGDEYRNALDALKKAEADLKAAQTPVLAALEAKPEYKAATEKQVKADMELRELQKGTPTGDQLTAATEKMVNAGAEVSKMKNDAMQASPAITEAKAKVQAAKDLLKSLHGKFDESLAADQDYQAATKLVDADKQKVDDAKKALADAQKQAAAQRKTSGGSTTPRSTPSPRTGGAGGGGRGY